MVALNVHICLILINEGLSPLLPLFLVPSIGLVPGVSADHVAREHGHIRFLQLNQFLHQVRGLLILCVILSVVDVCDLQHFELALFVDPEVLGLSGA